jgi:hypothetical protein
MVIDSRQVGFSLLLIISGIVIMCSPVSKSGELPASVEPSFVGGETFITPTSMTAAVLLSPFFS